MPEARMSHIAAIIAFLSLACLPLALSGSVPGGAGAGAAGAASLAQAQGCSLSFSGTVPPDASIASQSVADCFAWQEFIALNWPSATGAGFGDPGDYAGVAWQRYMSDHELFQPDGGPPPPWGTAPRIDPACLAEAGLTAQSAHGVIPMTMTSAFESEFTDGDSRQAAPQDGPSWLADVRGNNLWYEIRVDQDEYNAVVQNGWYNRQGQASWYQAHSGQALALPQNNYQTTPVTSGAMEVKAAWMQVPDPGNPKWQRYKVSRALVVNPKTQKCVAQTVALVGLHIIHKTQTQTTWVWATFEHVDNAPDAASAASAGSTGQAWNFYNPGCKPVQVAVPAACQFNGQATATVSCTPNQPPQYHIGQGCPAPAPIQVTRMTPIDSTAAAANAAAAAAIGGAYPRSVWSNYRLVNALWSTNPPPGQSPAVPQRFNSPQPNGPVANIALETYAQGTKCIDCHKYASISGNAKLPSDFSFALQEAQPRTNGLRMLRGKRVPVPRRIDR